MKEKTEPNILDRAFDHLSAKPWSKKVMQIMWKTSTIYFGIVIILECMALLMKKNPFRPELIKNIILFITINPLCAGMFYLWHKREMVSKKLKK